MRQRFGIGYDSHQFGAKKPLILGGVKIKHTSGLKGHSDGDAVAHALIDALLGAAAMGDIGPAASKAMPSGSATSVRARERRRRMAGRLGEIAEVQQIVLEGNRVDHDAVPHAVHHDDVEPRRVGVDR